MKRLTVVVSLAVASLAAPQIAFGQVEFAALDSTRDQSAQQEVKPQDPTAQEPPRDPSTSNDQAPKHVSTGWSALFKDTVRDFKSFPMRRSTWVILGVGGASAFAAKFGDNYVEQHIVGNKNADRLFSPGQWVGSSYTAIASSVGLWAVGRYIIPPGSDGSRTNKWSEMGFDLMRAEILSQTVTQGTKQIARRDRPTGVCCSFPSGHASSAFAAAAVIERHLGYRRAWPFIVGASYVGASRLVDGRHFLSDVVFGAAVGTAAGWTVVGKHGANALTVQPMLINGGVVISATRVPRR